MWIKNISRCFIASLLVSTWGLTNAVVPVAMGQANPTPMADPPQNAQPLEFDVATIKPNKSGSNSIYDYSVAPPPDGFVVKNMPLKMLISEAYGVRSDLISGGPKWIEADRYDITGKITNSASQEPQKLSVSQRNQMIQRLLSDRFKLVVHVITKQLPVYELTIAKDGSKLKISKPGRRLDYGANDGDIVAKSTPISMLADFLSDELHRTIVDKTGLTETYDFKLKWASDSAPVTDNSVSSDRPSLFTAIQEQLGLKLEPAKGLVPTLVIDHVERPSEN